MAVQRYDLITNYRCGSSIDEMECAAYGDWVRFDDFEAQRDALLAALKEAENALLDYIPTLERQGASLNYGHSVLRKVRAAITAAEPK